MRIDDQIETRNFRKDEVLFNAGDPPDDAFVIDSGRVDIVIDNYGEPLVIETLGRGDFVGEIALIDERPRTATAIAREDTHCAVFTKAEFDRALEKSDLLAVTLLHVLTKRLRESSKSNTLGEDYAHLDSNSKP